jgi:hypothetical protein|tara:strand:+ start:385 stop:495 length:111 start_codon:yes stop_codon:yes gene_type:complete
MEEIEKEIVGKANIQCVYFKVYMDNKKMKKFPTKQS